MADRSPLREYYDAQMPSAACVERLKALESSAEPEPLPPRRWVKALTAAAMLVFIVGVSLWSKSLLLPKQQPAADIAATAPPVDLAEPSVPLAGAIASAEPTPAPAEPTPAPLAETPQSTEPVESMEPPAPLPAAGSDEPPENDGSGSGAAVPDPFWWLHMGSSGSGQPGSSKGSAPGGETDPEPLTPTYYTQDGRFYLRLSDREAVMQVYDMTDLLNNGAYSGPLQFRDKTVWVDLKIAEDGSVSLTVH